MSVPNQEIDHPQKWISDHRIPIVKRDASLASSTRRRVITGNQIRSMIEEAVAKDRKSWILRVEEESKKKVDSVRRDLQNAIQEFEKIRATANVLQAENEKLRQAGQKLQQEKKILIVEQQAAIQKIQELHKKLDQSKQEIEEQKKRNPSVIAAPEPAAKQERVASQDKLKELQDRIEKLEGNIAQLLHNRMTMLPKAASKKRASEGNGLKKIAKRAGKGAATGPVIEKNRIAARPRKKPSRRKPSSNGNGHHEPEA